MSVLYIANIEHNKFSGIYRKIESHLKVLSMLKKKCKLICKIENKIMTVEYKEGILTNESIDSELEFSIKNLNKVAIKEITQNNFDIIYYRNTLKPSIHQLHLFKLAKKNKSKIIFEVPTYPYFKEQLLVSRNKILTFCKLVVDTIFFYYLYYYSDIVPIVLSNTQKKLLKKMSLITNGISENDIPIREKPQKKDRKLVLIGVGTLYPYHGYERVITALTKVKKFQFEFRVIGDGPEIKNLKKITMDLDLEEQVRFLGRMDKTQLDKAFEDSDIGISALSLYKRDADVDTTLKLIDYLTRGVPAISSDQNEMSHDNTLIYKVSNDDQSIDLDAIGEWYSSIAPKSIQSEQRKNIYKYSWNNILRNVLNEIGE